MNYRSVAQLSDRLLHWTRQLPDDFDLVVGVPRSGLLAANLLGLYLNLPIADVEGFLAGRTLTQGRRGEDQWGPGEDAESFLSTPRKVLVLDDSVRYGRAMREVRARIEASGCEHEVVYGAVYVHPDHLDAVDVYAEVLMNPRLFEWNVMHHSHLRKACLDIDGVLCRDPTVDENDDGEQYRTFLCNARPYLIPTVEVGWLVTSRLERYRAETEAWLAAHGVRYRELVMLDHPSGEWRRRLKIHAAFKADVYRATGASLFVESSVKQAVEIARLAQREVLCIDTMQMVYPDTAPVPRQENSADHHQRTQAEKLKRWARGAARGPVRALKRLAS